MDRLASVRKKNQWNASQATTSMLQLIYVKSVKQDIIVFLLLNNSLAPVVYVLKDHPANNNVHKVSNVQTRHKPLLYANLDNT